MLRERPERVMVLRVPELDFEQGSGKPPAPSASPALAPDEVARRERRWARILRAVEALMPGVEPFRTGWCALRARGPARYYGGEETAAAMLVGCARERGCAEATVGVASGRFAAEQAARSMERDPGVEAPEPGVRIVAPEATEQLLGPLPVGRAADEELAQVLVGLGIRTLGALASLPETAVGERFGAAGLAAHRRARGASPQRSLEWVELPAPEVRPREAPPELDVRFACEPPLDGAEQLAFASSTYAETLVRGLAARGLVCTELRIGLTDDAGVRHERLWAHPARFTAADVVNRLRWQAASLAGRAEGGGSAGERSVGERSTGERSTGERSTGDDGERGGAGIAEVLLSPVRTARAADHEPGLWSDAPDDRVHHHLSRVQSLLGHEGVGTGELLGGRTSADRQRLVPWGTPTTAASASASASVSAPASARIAGAGPWPGHLTGAKPSLVFAEPVPARLLDRTGAEIAIDSAGLLSAEPARLGVALGAALEVGHGDGAENGTGSGAGSDADRRPVRPLPAGVLAWSAPWPLRERWWRSGTSRDSGSRHRLQLLLDDGDAWLLSHVPGRGWAADARYA